MDRQQEGDRWNRASRKPLSLLTVLLVVDCKVIVGHWNERRGMWFALDRDFGERPVSPTHWRPTPRLPKNLLMTEQMR